MAESKMAQVAAMLGVELGEEFEIEGFEGLYFISDYGLVNEHGNYRPTALMSLINGNKRITKIPWRPKDGEMYYYWADDTTNDIKVDNDIFYAKVLYDLKNVLIGNCYPTKEAAEADKDKFMELMKTAQEAMRK